MREEAETKELFSKCFPLFMWFLWAFWNLLTQIIQVEAWGAGWGR